MIDVIMMTNYNRNSILPNCGIFNCIERNLKTDKLLIHSTTPDSVIDEAIENAMNDNVNRFILVNSPTAFAKDGIRRSVGILLYKAKRSIFVQNDYVLLPPSQCKSGAIKEFADYKGESSDYYGFDELWSILPATKKERIKRTLVNWNVLTYRELPYNSYDNRMDKIVYYGSARANRIKPADKYFNSIEYELDLSYAPNSPINKKRFGDYSCNHVPKFENLYESLSQYKASIILTDDNIPVSFMPNRFYECLSTYTVMFFDVGIVPMLKYNHIEGYEDYVVSNDIELGEKLRTMNLPIEATIQHHMWSKSLPYLDSIVKELLYDDE